MFCTAPPTTSFRRSAPSMVTLPPRLSWPADEITTVFVFVGSKFGAGIARNEQRQFEEIAAVQRQTFHFRDSITPWTSESWLSINGALPTSAVFPVMAATSSGAFNVTVWPT